MNISKLILSFSCGKVNFSRSILLLKRGFCVSEEMKVVCLLCLSDDKSSPGTFWAVCQMTNRSQRRFEPFVRWQIALRDVLSHLSDDKLPAETFWVVCQMTNHSQRRFEPFVRWQIVPRDVFGMSDPSTSRKMTIWAHLHSGVFAWKGIFMDCHADARNDGYEVTGLPRWRSQWTGMRPLDCHADARDDGLGIWVYKSFFSKIFFGGNLSKVFSRARG